MPTLNHAITAALREVELSLTHQREEGKFPVGLERVQLTLAFALDGDGTVNASPGGPHSLTISFKPGELSAKTLASPAPPAASLPRPIIGPAGEITEALSQVVGAPGFDPSARASGLREAVEGMSQEQVLEVLTAVLASPSASADNATRMSAHLLRGVIQSGPTKALDRGVTTLRDLLTRHSLTEILRVVDTEWKTQMAWL